MTAPGRDGNDALAALERLLRHNIIPEDQAQAAARLITGDPNVVFPRPPAEPPAPAAPAAQATEAPAADNASASGSETP